MLRELSGLSIESLRVRPVCVDQAWPIVVLSAVKVHTPTRLRIVEGGKQRGNDEAPVGNLSIFKALHCTCRTCRVLQFTVAAPSTSYQIPPPLWLWTHGFFL